MISFLISVDSYWLQSLVKKYGYENKLVRSDFHRSSSNGSKTCTIFDEKIQISNQISFEISNENENLPHKQNTWIFLN